MFLGILASFAPAAMAQANVQGQWQTMTYLMPINPIHAALLYNGKVLVIAGSGNYPPNTTYQWAIWDPQAGTITVQTSGWDMFCNGMAVLPDGRPFVAGGTIRYDPTFYGSAQTAIYDVLNDTLADAQPMAHGRWYPTNTILGDGRMMTFSGLTETGGTNNAVEIYTVGQGWSQQYIAPWTPPLYPRLHVLPNGNVFYSGSSTSSSIFNPTNQTWDLGVATTNYSGTRLYGSSVLFPLTPANGYKPKVMIMGGGIPATTTTEIIDLSQATPKWVYGPNMSEPRIEMNATMLPTGKILLLGGSLNDEDETTASLNADLYDPVANTMSHAGTEAYARLYHSVSLLMPDATVWVAGSNPERGTYEPHMEIYSPAYLFNSDGSLATRPTITGVSTPVIGYGSAFTVTTPDAANISTAVLMRNGSVTHAFNMDQRYVGLSFTAGSGVLNMTGPPNGNIAPPGYYMLFLINNAGVPSVASMLQISTAPTDTPPTGIITNPASNTTIVAGQSISYAGTATSPDGTITGYSWFFEGGTPDGSNLANPGNVTYETQGTYVTTFTVTDSTGLTDPNPPTLTITVLPPSDFSLSAAPSSQTVSQGGATMYTATVTAGTAFTGPVTFSLKGLPAGATVSFTPPTVTTSGSSTLTVTTTSTTPVGSYSLTITGTSGGLTQSIGVTLVVQVPPTPMALASPTSLSFGNQLVGSPSTAQPVKLANTGTAALNITGISASGDFTETNTCGTALAANASCNISIVFDPSQTGNRTGTLSLADNAAGSPQTVNLTGTGVAPSASFAPASLSFASQLIGSASTVQAITLTNGGTATLSVSGISASGDFSETNTCGTALAAGTSCTISVVFDPTQNGTRTGTLSVADNATGSPQAVSLSGTGVTASPAVSLSPMSLSFGSQIVGQKTSAQTIAFANSGTATLNITGISASGDFSETNNCASSLAVGASCTISVVFQPSQGGTRAGTVTVVDSVNSSHVALSGTGMDFSLTAAPNAGSVPAGQTANFSVTPNPEGGFNQGVTLSCTGAPATANCSVSPASVMPSNAAAISITTTARSATWPVLFGAPPELRMRLLVVLTMLGIVLFAMAQLRRRVKLALCAATLVILAATGCANLASNGNSPSPAPTSSPTNGSAGTPAGTYTITVTATSGTLTHSTTYSLTVQ